MIGEAQSIQMGNATGNRYALRLSRLRAARRTNWDNQYEILSQYFFCLKKNQFLSRQTDGMFINDGSLFSDDGITAARLFASMFLGLLWKGFNRSVVLRRPEYISDAQENKDYYAELQSRVAASFDDVRSRFVSSLYPVILEWVTYGTAALSQITRNDTPDVPMVFRPYSITGLYLSKGVYGTVDTVYFVTQMTMGEASDTFGIANLSESIQKRLEDETSRDQYIEICYAFEPRSDKERRDSFGNYLAGRLGMSYRGVVFETQTGHIIVPDEGYDGIPVHVTRQYVLPNETYGRSLAMDALPTVMAANATTEELQQSIQLMNRPPMWMANNAVTGNGLIDLSPGSATVVDFMGNSIQTPVAPIHTVGDINPMAQLLSSLSDKVRRKFHLDYLYDVMTQADRKTIPEVAALLEVQSAVLTPYFIEFLTSVIQPSIERQVSSMFSRGLLGSTATSGSSIPGDTLVVPAEVQAAMAAGRDFYHIEIISPAMRLINAADRQAAMDFTSLLSQVAPDRIARDKIADDLPRLTGAPDKYLRSLIETQADRQAQAQAQAEINNKQMANMDAKTNMANSQAQSMIMGQQTNATRMQMQTGGMI